METGEVAIIAALLIALVSAAPTTVAPAAPPAPPPPAQIQPLPYFSELSRAGLTPKMFKRPIQPKANLVALFSTDDYPLQALRNLEQGTVAAVVRVGADGRVMDCIVVQSSGSPSLDLQTCRIIWTRARFEPARDGKGRPVESALRQRIRWQLPEPDPTPIKPWSARFTIDFVEDGGAIACKMETTGALKADQEFCDPLSGIWEAALAAVRSDAGYKRSKLILETQFAPDDRISPAKAPAGTELVARQVARLTIDATGKTLQCRVVETEGSEAMITGCEELLSEQFEKPAIAVGAIEATMMQSIFIGR